MRLLEFLNATLLDATKHIIPEMSDGVETVRNDLSIRLADHSQGREHAAQKMQIVFQRHRIGAGLLWISVCPASALMGPNRLN